MSDAANTIDQTHWHAHSSEAVLERLDSSAHGLRAEEAKQRLAEHGPNSIRTGPGVSPWAIFLHQFTSPLIYILLVAMVITAVIGEYGDSIVIAFVLALNATIGFIQEYRGERDAGADEDGHAAGHRPAGWRAM